MNTFYKLFRIFRPRRFYPLANITYMERVERMAKVIEVKK